jgi:DNA-binding beta-propeller fold protein YncE
MKTSARRRWSLLAAACLIAVAGAQNPSAPLPKAPAHAPLVLTGSIPMPGVQGRIDHMSLDPQGRLFLSALGNNTVEVLDLGGGVRAAAIPNIPRPQGVVYVAELNKLFVGSDEGKLHVYDGASYRLIVTIDFGDDVDNLRYDAANKLVYVGYGDGDEGAIGVVDAATNQRLAKNYKLGAHPESFQLEHSGANIYVNVPDLKQIVVVNRSTGAITHWPVPFEANFPMALDEAEQRVFVATRGPARMAVFDTKTGRLVTSVPCVQGSDDLYFDAARKRVYVTGGEGYISVFQEKDADHFEALASVPSAVGARTSGYFGRGRKGFDIFFVAVPARVDRGAEILMYTVQD